LELSYKQEAINIYCNSCQTEIKKGEITYCTQCAVPLHKKCANHCLTCGKELCDRCFADNNYYCDECKPPVEGFEKIRRSHIELFNTCPYALYLILIKGIVPPSNDYALVGTMLHELIDQMSAGMIFPSEALMNAVKFIDELDTDKRERFYKTAEKTINGFWEISGMFSEKFESEYNVIYSLGEDLPKVSCTIDRIDFVDDKIHVADWKTGKSMTGKKLVSDLQAPLYLEAVNQKFGKYPETFTFYYFAEDKVKQYNKQPGDKVTYIVRSGKTDYVLDIDDALERTRTILRKINNKQFTIPKDVGLWYCKNMCWFYDNGICASVGAEQWKMLSEKYAKGDVSG